MKFAAELLSTGKNTAGFEVPEDVVESLGGGGHPKVSVTVNGYTFRTSIARMGGRNLLGFSAERRTEAGVSPGEMFEVDVELDTAERVLDVPEALKAALATDARAKAFWETLSYSKQQWHVLQVTSAKTDATRTDGSRSRSGCSAKAGRADAVHRRTADRRGARFPPPELAEGIAALGAEAVRRGVLVDTAGLLPVATATRVGESAGESEIRQVFGLES